MADYSSLSIAELKQKLNQKKKLLRKNYKEKLIRDIRKIDEINQKIKKGVTIKKKPKPKKKLKTKKIKTFDEYFQECIKNKKIPADTPLIFVRLLRELSKSIIKDLKKKNQL